MVARRERRIQELELENARLKERIEEYERSYKRSAEVRSRCYLPDNSWPRALTLRVAYFTLSHIGGAGVAGERALEKQHYPVSRHHSRQGLAAVPRRASETPHVPDFFRLSFPG